MARCRQWQSRVVPQRGRASWRDSPRPGRVLTEGAHRDRPPDSQGAAVMPLLTSHHATARPGDDGAPGNIEG